MKNNYTLLITLLIGVLSVVSTDSSFSVDPSTLDNKILIGYQGWFNTPSDGADVGWRHWSHSTSHGPTSNDAVFDLWPAMEEYVEKEDDPTLVYQHNNPVQFFSSYRKSTTQVHFRWLQQYSLDGVFLQRFLNEVESDPAFFKERNQVLLQVADNAQRFGRTFAVMYDLSGAKSESLVSDFQSDWWYLTHQLDITNRTNYQFHNGKPVVAVWGLGFTGHPGNYSQSYNIINWLQLNGFFVMGGTPFNWRDSSGDSKPNFQGVYEKLDLISPWSVGRYDSMARFNQLHKKVQIPDKRLTDSRKQGYAPVMWPGFSWSNLQKDPSLFNQIPRQGGDFFSGQADVLIPFKPTFIYIAMFDEVNESTAIMKAANSTEQLPTTGNWLYLGYNSKPVPQDHYLKLTQSFTQRFHQLSN